MSFNQRSVVGIAFIIMVTKLVRWLVIIQNTKVIAIAEILLFFQQQYAPHGSV
jgi:hypothetical protein